MFSFDKHSVRWKLALIAILIVAATLIYSNYLARKLGESERQNSLLWGQAFQVMSFPIPLSGIANIDNENKLNERLVQEYQNFILYQIINDSTRKIERILEDWEGKYSGSNPVERKIPPNIGKQEETELLKEMATNMEVIPINMGAGEDKILKVYYKESSILRQLRYYPYVQLFIAFVFLSIVLIAFNIARREEQNRIWAGLAKETAHQLGTPVSSLLAWIEYLRLTNEENHENEEALSEMEHDISRLQNITHRFSRVGSKPELSPQKLAALLESATDYMRKRMSKQVSCTLTLHIPHELIVPLNDQLFEWVIENLLKNALDAMEGKEGKINIEAHLNDKYSIIDVTDTGKGMPKSMYERVFKPGFTTKERGWGLGLSLSKRIIEMYHNGKIFVKESEIGKGTTFRIMLKR